jgi:ketosteroid isomerase-like protein
LGGRANVIALPRLSARRQGGFQQARGRDGSTDKEIGMSEGANKALVRKAYESMGEQGVSSFMDCLSDDVTWTFFGSHVFSGRLSGKREIEEKLLVPMGEVVTSFRFHVDNLIAEGDQVVVEGRGEAPTNDGRHYNNTYCIIVTVRDGKITRIREYLDSELVTSIFGHLRKSR